MSVDESAVDLSLVDDLGYQNECGLSLLWLISCTLHQLHCAIWLLTRPMVSNCGAILSPPSPDLTLNYLSADIWYRIYEDHIILSFSIPESPIISHLHLHWLTNSLSNLFSSLSPSLSAVTFWNRLLIIWTGSVRNRERQMKSRRAHTHFAYSGICSLLSYRRKEGRSQQKKKKWKRWQFQQKKRYPTKINQFTEASIPAGDHDDTRNSWSTWEFRHRPGHYWRSDRSHHERWWLQSTRRDHFRAQFDLRDESPTSQDNVPWHCICTTKNWPWHSRMSYFS